MSYLTLKQKRFNWFTTGETNSTWISLYIESLSVLFVPNYFVF